MTSPTQKGEEWRVVYALDDEPGSRQFALHESFPTRAAADAYARKICAWEIARGVEVVGPFSKEPTP